MAATAYARGAFFTLTASLIDFILRVRFVLNCPLGQQIRETFTNPPRQSFVLVAAFPLPHNTPRQGLWSADLRIPPGPEGSNGSMLCNCRSHPGIFPPFPVYVARRAI